MLVVFSCYCAHHYVDQRVHHVIPSLSLLFKGAYFPQFQFIPFAFGHSDLRISQVITCALSTLHLLGQNVKPSLAIFSPSSGGTTASMSSVKLQCDTPFFKDTTPYLRGLHTISSGCLLIVWQEAEIAALQAATSDMP